MLHWAIGQRAENIVARVAMCLYVCVSLGASRIRSNIDVVLQRAAQFVQRLEIEHFHTYYIPLNYQSISAIFLLHFLSVFC